MTMTSTDRPQKPRECEHYCYMTMCKANEQKHVCYKELGYHCPDFTPKTKEKDGR